MPGLRVVAHPALDRLAVGLLPLVGLPADVLPLLAGLPVVGLAAVVAAVAPVVVAVADGPVVAAAGAVNS